MFLSQYLEKNNISIQDFAKQIKLSRQQVYHYMAKYGTDKFNIPSKSVMLRIMEATDNQVQPQSFFLDLQVHMKEQRKKNQRRRNDEKLAGNREMGEAEKGV